MKCNSNEVTPQAFESNPFSVTITAINCQTKISLGTAIANTNVAWASSGSYTAANGAIYSTTASATRCPFTYDFQKSGVTYSPSWATFSSSTGNLLLDLSTEFVEDGVAPLTINMLSTNGATLDSAAFTLAVCKSLVLSTVTPAFTFVAPNTAGAALNVIAHAVYASTVGCPITYSIIDSTTSATISSWLAVDSVGQVTVDQNTLDTKTVKVRMVYNGATYDTSAFSVTVGCAAFSVNTITASNTYEVPSSSAALVTVVAGSAWLTSTSSLAGCAITYAVHKSSDNSLLGGTWLTVSASGDIQVDKNVLGTESVYVKYTRATVVADSSTFSVTVNCPTITLTAITTPSANIVPNTGGAVSAAVVAGNAWHSASYIAGICLPTYVIIKQSSGVALTGNFLTVASDGQINVDIV